MVIGGLPILYRCQKLGFFGTIPEQGTIHIRYYNLKVFLFSLGELKKSSTKKCGFSAPTKLGFIATFYARHSERQREIRKHWF